MAEDGPEQVERDLVELVVEDQLDAAAHVQPSPFLPLQSPPVDLVVARGRLGDGAPQRRDAFLDVGEHGDPGVDARVARPDAELGEDLTLDERHRLGVADHGDVDHPAQELLLRAEPGVHGLHRHAGAPGDRRDGGPRPAGLLEQRRRRGEHLGPGLPGLAPAEGGGVLPPGRGFRLLRRHGLHSRT